MKANVEKMTILIYPKIRATSNYTHTHTHTHTHTQRERERES